MKTAKLRMARLALGLSQSELAENAGCSRALISMIENGYVLPRPAMAARIAEAVGLSEDALFEQSRADGEDGL